MEFEKQAEKRITRIVYCAEQLISKRQHIWVARYERACADAQSVEELDEATLRIDKKFPRLKLKKIVEEQQKAEVQAARR